MRASTRRDFIARSGRAALGAALFSPARSLAAQLTGHAAWRDLIAHLEAQIPTLMTELFAPGVSVALIRDGRHRVAAGNEPLPCATSQELCLGWFTHHNLDRRSLEATW